MIRFDPERVIETHYEQYLDEPGEWLGVLAIAQITQEAIEQIPEVQLVIVTFGEEDWQKE